MVDIVSMIRVNVIQMLYLYVSFVFLSISRYN